MVITSKLVVTINTTHKLVVGKKLGTTYLILAAISVLPENLSGGLGVTISGYNCNRLSVLPHSCSQFPTLIRFAPPPLSQALLCYHFQTLWSG